LVKDWNHVFHMTNGTTPETPTETPTRDALMRALAQLTREGSPAISGLAQWVLEQPQELAFHSVRGLAEAAGVNVNTAYRLALALGFSGYDDCRRAFQEAMRQTGGLYGARAMRLSRRGEGARLDELREAAQSNLDEAFSDSNVARIRQAAQRLLTARRIYCVGVRSCLSLAHYLSYTGRMAFPHFERPLIEPGSIADMVAQAEPGDVVILITFSLYSAEVVRAHEAAIAKGLEVIAITDSYASPIAREAELVFCLPMAGPQPLPSHGAGFALVEGIVSEMVAASEDAPARIMDFERTMLELSSYVTTN
jgi:DNA-binding MurR/RpiR family transcriptional regulator